MAKTEEATYGATRITYVEARSYAAGCFMAADECRARGSYRAAEIHQETGDSFATIASLLSIRNGNGI